MGPNPMTSVLISKGKFGHTDINADRMPRDDGSRDWSAMFTRQGTHGEWDSHSGGPKG